jgi:hypothetical protein
MVDEDRSTDSMFVVDVELIYTPVEQLYQVELFYCCEVVE